MEFSNKAKDLLAKAGWKAGRYISKADLKLPYDDYPQNVVEFLQEYGNLEGQCAPLDYTEVINDFYLYPEMSKEDLEGDNYYPYYESVVGRKLYPVGAYLPDGFYICCDVDGRVYMIGEYCYYWGKNIYEGLDRILLNNWRNSLQLDEDTGKWWNDNTEYVDLPPLE
jgi:hypothetical protein